VCNDARPIPLSLWRRLAALDARCDMLQERCSVARDRCGQGNRNYSRLWRETITEREGATGRGPLVCEAAWFVQALEGAVRRRRGMEGGAPDRGPHESEPAAI
jgi:hypothetical protein